MLSVHLIPVLHHWHTPARVELLVVHREFAWASCAYQHCGTIACIAGRICLLQCLFFLSYPDHYCLFWQGAHSGGSSISIAVLPGAVGERREWTGWYQHHMLLEEEADPVDWADEAWAEGFPLSWWLVTAVAPPSNPVSLNKTLFWLNKCFDIIFLH